MDPVSNPYNPGAGTQPPVFIGRDELIQDFRVALERTIRGKPGKSLVPIGLRGVGKTVLLNRFIDIAIDRGCKIAFIEAPENGAFQQTLAAKIRKVLADLDSSGPLSVVVKRALSILKSFSVSVGTDGSTTLAIAGDPLVGTADSGILAEDLTDLLVAVGEAARDRSTCVVIACDEIQYLNEEEFGALIAAVHRTTQLALPLILVGTGLPAIPMLAGNAKSYAERLFNFPRITSLNDEDAREAIADPASDQGVTYEPEALDAIVRVTSGYPYFIQEWGYEVWNAADRTPISADVVSVVHKVVQEKLDRSFFSVRLDRLTPSERKYLRAMAGLGSGPHRSGDIAGRYGATVESVAPIRSSLIRKGMVYSPAHGDTAFTVPLFDEFMRRVVPEEPKKSQKQR